MHTVGCLLALKKNEVPCQKMDAPGDAKQIQY